eukprot:2175737-Prymnesium_polylepis.1
MQLLYAVCGTHTCCHPCSCVQDVSAVHAHAETDLRPRSPMRDCGRESAGRCPCCMMSGARCWAPPLHAAVVRCVARALRARSDRSSLRVIACGRAASGCFTLAAGSCGAPAAARL